MEGVAPRGASNLALDSGEDAFKRQVSGSRFVKGSLIPKPSNVDGQGLLAILLHPLSVLLVGFPLGCVSFWKEWGEVLTFWFLFFSLIPLAKILGDATEELAAGLKNDMLAGLLNATFGNAVEMVITIQTLRAGLLDVVKATLLGSVLSNMLLVLGMSFFCGGLVASSSAPVALTVDKRGSTYQKMDRTSTNPAESLSKSTLPTLPEEQEVIHTTSTVSMGVVGEKVQSFSVLSALVNTSMLLLSCLSLSLVTVFHSSVADIHGQSLVEDEILLKVSRVCAIIIQMAYCAYIVFQLFTHKEAMAENEDGGEDQEEEEPALSITGALVVLCITTVIVAFASDLLVDTIEAVTEKSHINKHFIGIILLPIVGNACEHAAAVRFAMQDKPGLSIGIAVGSSTQISLFVVPFSVLIGWAIRQPMDLNFGALNTIVMTLSVIVVLSVVVDGHSNWLQGYLLCSAYAVISVLYWFLPDSHTEG